MSEGFAWLLFALILGSIVFLPSVAALLFKRAWFIPVALLNAAVFVDWLSPFVIIFYGVVTMAVLFSVRPSLYLPAWLLPTRRRWIERQCPACTQWMARTANSCPQCKSAVSPLDQPCPSCAAAMPPTASVCLACGHDQGQATI